MAHFEHDMVEHDSNALVQCPTEAKRLFSGFRKELLNQGRRRIRQKLKID